MRAPPLVSALGLARNPQRSDEWIGARGRARVGLQVRSRAPGVVLFAEHPVPLRAGLLIEERADVLNAGGRTAAVSTVALRRLDDLPVSPPELAARIRARALERDVAIELLRAAASRLLALAAYGELAVDDQRVWLAWSGDLQLDPALTLFDEMSALSSALVATRAQTPASFERALGTTWSELASALELTWHPERSAITGERRGASIELRVDGEPGLLYTEIYLEWPSLRRGLVVERRAPRGREGVAPPADAAAMAAELHAAYRVKGRLDPSPEMMRGALSVGEIGASLLADDTGLVARVDEVVVDRAKLGSLVRGALALGLGLRAPRGTGGAYR